MTKNASGQSVSEKSQVTWTSKNVFEKSNSKTQYFVREVKDSRMTKNGVEFLNSKSIGKKSTNLKRQSNFNQWLTSETLTMRRIPRRNATGTRLPTWTSPGQMETTTMRPVILRMTIRRMRMGQSPTPKKHHSDAQRRHSGCCTGLPQVPHSPEYQDHGSKGPSWCRQERPGLHDIVEPCHCVTDTHFPLSLPLCHGHTLSMVTDTHQHIDRDLYTYMTSYLDQDYRLSILIDKSTLFIDSWLIRLWVDNVLLINTRTLSILIDKSIPLSIGIPRTLTSHIHWVTRGTGTPKDRDEVNRRGVSECDGWECDLEVIDVSSIFKLILKTTTLMRMLSTLSLNCEEKTVRWKWKSPLVGSGRWTPYVAKQRQFVVWECEFVFLLFVYHESIKWELWVVYCCLLWIDKVRVKEKTYIWVSVDFVYY